MRVFPFLFFSILLLFSCDTEQESNVSNDCVPIIIAEDVFQNLPSASPLVQLITIEEDCLTIELTVSGCDDDHDIDMISDGGIGESLPVQMTFVLRDNDLQACEAIFTIEREFDLSKVRELVDADVIIRFINSDQSILYPK